jgi:hypothetical protein
VFGFIATAYENSSLSNTRWATDQTHFYIFATALINEAKLNPILPKSHVGKLIKFDTLLNGEGLDAVDNKFRRSVKKYLDLSAKQTTDVTKRQDREKLFREILGLL